LAQGSDVVAEYLKEKYALVVAWAVHVAEILRHPLASAVVETVTAVETE
jgi:hypothetical protein